MFPCMEHIHAQMMFIKYLDHKKNPDSCAFFAQLVLQLRNKKNLDTSDVEWTWCNVLVEANTSRIPPRIAYVHIKAKRKFNNQMKGLFIFTFCFYILGLSTFAMVKQTLFIYPYLAFSFCMIHCKGCERGCGRSFSILHYLPFNMLKFLSPVLLLLTCTWGFHFSLLLLPLPSLPQKLHIKIANSRIFDAIRYRNSSKHCLFYYRRPLYVWMLY